MLHVWPHLKDNNCPQQFGWYISKTYKIQWLKKDLLVPNANHDFTREKNMWIISALLVKWSALANSFTLECFTQFSFRIYLINFTCSSSMGFRDTFCLGSTWDPIQKELHIGFYFGPGSSWMLLEIILGFTWDAVQKELYLRFSYTNEPCFKIMSMNLTWG